MFETPTTAAPPTPQPDQPAEVTRSGRLLLFIRVLIDFGTTLLNALNSPEARVRVTRRYGNLNIDLIRNRILHGLHLANALTTRVTRSTRNFDRARAKPAESAKPQQPLGVTPDKRLPSAQAIAAQVRAKGIGALISQICEDFEIINGDRLWLESVGAIAAHRGPTLRFMRNMLRRIKRTGYYIANDPWPASAMPHGVTFIFCAHETGPPLNSF